MDLSKDQEQLLKQAKALKDLSLQAGWVDYLKPYLEDKLNQSFPDPSQFKSTEEFNYAAMVASVFKKVVAEILIYMDGQANAYDELTSKKKQTKDPFKVGK